MIYLHKKTLFALFFALILVVLSTLIPVRAEDWFTSPFGEKDTLGAVNHLSPQKAQQAAKLVTRGKVYQLGMVSGPDTPAYGPRKFQMIVHQLGDGTGTVIGVNKAVSNDDIVLTSIGIGSQIDGLGHFGRDHVYYNNFEAADVVAPDGLKIFGTDKLPGIVTRGVLLDMTKYFKKTPVPTGTVYTEDDIKNAAQQQGITIGKGDVVLLHSGTMKANEGKKELMSGEPGLGITGAHYLSRLGVVAVGADTWALEVLPGEIDAAVFPVHQILLTKYGVYILENMVTHELAADGVGEFMFTLGVPKLKGAVQAIVNPLAVR